MIPRGPDTLRPRTAYGLVVLDGIERLTTALRRGDPFSSEALDDMAQLRRRLEAFAHALEDRLQAHAIVLEEDDG